MAAAAPVDSVFFFFLYLMSEQEKLTFSTFAAAAGSGVVPPAFSVAPTSGLIDSSSRQTSRSHLPTLDITLSTSTLIMCVEGGWSSVFFSFSSLFSVILKSSRAEYSSSTPSVLVLVAPGNSFNSLVFASFAVAVASAPTSFSSVAPPGHWGTPFHPCSSVSRGSSSL